MKKVRINDLNLAYAAYACILKKYIDFSSWKLKAKFFGCGPSVQVAIPNIYNASLKHLSIVKYPVNTLDVFQISLTESEHKWCTNEIMTAYLKILMMTSLVLIIIF